ncbi:MAG: L-threonylcarbamoyladenylate synthase [Eubacteriales bacterium]
MKTERIIINPNPIGGLTEEYLMEHLESAAEYIKNGEVVAFPTETVYGLGADAYNVEACKNIFKVKGRPSDNPLIVHIASREEVNLLTSLWTEKAEICANNFWPGPLTLILPKSDKVPREVSGGLETVAIRMPSHPVAVALIKKAGCPIAAPSANLSGKPSPTEGEHVWRDLAGRVPLIIDMGKCDIGLESTVLDLTGKIPIILRPGGITKEELEAVLGNVELDKAIGIVNTENGGTDTFIPKSPGMKYRHYAPEGQIFIFSRGKLEEEMVSQNIYGDVARRIAVLCTNETEKKMNEELKNRLDYLYVLGSGERPREVAANLFEALRLCDENKIDIIFAEGIDERGIGLAVMNRLKKAAGKNKA